MPGRHAAAAVAAALVLGVAAQYLFVRERPGLNVPLAVALFLTLAWTLRDRRRSVAIADVWLPVSALALAASCAVRADGPLLAFDALASTAFAVAWLGALRGVTVTDLPLLALLGESLSAAGAALARAAPACAAAWPVLQASAPLRSRRAASYGAGLFLAAPFLLVFVSLFSSADAVFQRALTDALDAMALREWLAQWPQRAAFAAIVAWCAAGAFAWLHDAPRAEARRRAAIVGAEPVTAMLVAIDVLFVLFVGIQLAYLFGGGDTIAATGLTYSSYARRGFFELVAVATLVAGLLFASDLAVRDRARPYRAAAIVLVALSAVVLVSAATRIDLYQRAYGWTELRFYAAAAIAFLALAHAVLAWAVVRARMDVALQRIAIAAVAVALAANAIGPSATVARANIDRFLESSASVAADDRPELDFWYLLRLGDGAVPALVERRDALPEEVRARLDQELRALSRWRAPLGGWQSWNLERARAEELLGR